MRLATWPTTATVSPGWARAISWRRRHAGDDLVPRLAVGRASAEVLLDDPGGARAHGADLDQRAGRDANGSRQGLGGLPSPQGGAGVDPGDGSSASVRAARGPARRARSAGCLSCPRHLRVRLGPRRGADTRCGRGRSRASSSLDQSALKGVGPGAVPPVVPPARLVRTTKALPGASLAGPLHLERGAEGEGFEPSIPLRV